MNKINVITLVLFSVGISSGLMILYDHFINPHIISREQAISIAMKAGYWTPQELGNDTIDAELLQAKLSNRIAFVINPTTLSPDQFPKTVSLSLFDVKENQLFWNITIKKQLKGQEYSEWGYFVDATNGTLLKN